jgi:hypothetical protein
MAAKLKIDLLQRLVVITIRCSNVDEAEKMFKTLVENLENHGGFSLNTDKAQSHVLADLPPD